MDCLCRSHDLRKLYGVTAIPRETDVPWHKRPAFWAIVVAAVFVVLNIIFW